MRVENIPIQNTAKAEGKTSRDIDGFTGILEGLIFTKDKEGKKEAVSFVKEGERVENLIEVEKDEKEDINEVLGFFYPGGLEFKPRQLDFQGQENLLAEIQDSLAIEGELDRLMEPEGNLEPGLETKNLEEANPQDQDVQAIDQESHKLEFLDLEPIDFKPLNMEALEFSQSLKKEEASLEEEDYFHVDQPDDLKIEVGIHREVFNKTMEEGKIQEPRAEGTIGKEAFKIQGKEEIPGDSDLDSLNSKDDKGEKIVTLEEVAEGKEVYLAKEDMISSLGKIKEKPKNSKFQDILINQASRVKNSWIDKPLPPDLEDLGLENIHRLADRIIDSIKVTNLDTGSLMEVQLYPEELGALNIKLKLEDGKIIGRILVENQVVKSLLVNSLGQLNQNLAKENINLERLEIHINTGLNGNLAEKSFSENQGQRDSSQALRNIFKRDPIKSMGITNSGLLLDQRFGSSGVNILV